MDLQALTEELQGLTEADPAFAKTQEMPVHPGTGAAPSKCPKGFRKHPDTGKCWPRDQLKQLMRGHEPVAAMHREKHQHHALKAQELAATDPVKAQKHAARAANHLKQAQYHHGQYQAIHKELYPHKYKLKGPATTPDPLAANSRAPMRKGVQALPMIHMGHSVRSVGGQAWGAPRGGAASAPSQSPQGYHPFGPHAKPAPEPTHAPTHEPSAPSPAGAGEAPGAKKPSVLHTLGKSALHGLTHALAQRGAQSGSLGWSALAGALQHLTGAQPAATSHPPAPPRATAPSHPPAPAENPFAQPPVVKKKKPKSASPPSP